MQNYPEKKPISLPGLPMLFLIGAVLLWTIVDFTRLLSGDRGSALVVVSGLVFLASLPGFYIIQPNTSRVLTLLGRYAGSDSRQGLRWTIPFLIMRQSVSQRLRNFESATSKVNDAVGNPIEISGVIVWRIDSPANSVFGVEDVSEYVAMQGEAAIRSLANSYPYGGVGKAGVETITLQSNPNEICKKLKADMLDRVKSVGVDIVDARLSHLAYAPEIAAAMLQRQQADALIDAREVIVDGAVGIVGMALEQLKQQNVANLTDDQKAALVSNLLVVLSGDRTPQPVIQSGIVTT